MSWEKFVEEFGGRTEVGFAFADHYPAQHTPECFLLRNCYMQKDAVIRIKSLGIDQIVDAYCVLHY